MIKEGLEPQVPVILLYVLESKGSSPGRQGFFMAVNTSGKMEGSIGGGIMEHKFVEMAKDKLKESSKEASIRKQLHDKSAPKNQSGMICSGEQTILLYIIQPGDAPHIDSIISSLQEYKNGTLILSPEGIRFDRTAPEKDFEYHFQSDNNWLYKEKLGYKNQLFIIGGGHCALALSRMMRPMDFYITVIDDRIELKTMLENETAHSKCFVNSYTDLTQLIPSGESHYVVIMTFGYRTDDIAVRALLNKKFKFIGLMGSRSKIEKMFDDYRKEGLNEDWLSQLHTPIGLPIKSQTPEEIAVSIAAEIIHVKNDPHETKTFDNY
jgi:xanthine dehydrogenase accessory factor